ncbi:MAG: response regulator transcription factor [Vicinamibacteria bacterium]|jgi:DNA-binding NarL/FixJ family response regulator|nr:response regulator transcription factor [Vicinamibacteria bacterium]
MIPRIRVVLADDHAILRDGVRALLAAAADIEVVGEAADGTEAIARCLALRPDVALLDVNMPGLGGLEAALVLRRDCPDTKVLILSQHEDREYVARALQAGAMGYVLKKAAGAELVSAIRAVHRGGLVLDPAVAKAAMEPERQEDAGASDYDRLTDREKQVLRLVAEGRANKEVAEELGITVKTAMSHREHLMQKLGLHSRTELVKFALKVGVIQL